MLRGHKRTICQWLAGHSNLNCLSVCKITIKQNITHFSKQSSVLESLNIVLFSSQNRYVLKTPFQVSSRLYSGNAKICCCCFVVFVFVVVVFKKRVFTDTGLISFYNGTISSFLGTTLIPRLQLQTATLSGPFQLLWCILFLFSSPPVPPVPPPPPPPPPPLLARWADFAAKRRRLSC